MASGKGGVAIGIDEAAARARISRYELGVHEPPLQTTKPIVKALGVPLIYLYCKDDSVAQLLLQLYRLKPEDRKRRVTPFVNELAKES